LPNSHAVSEWHRLGGILLAKQLLTTASLAPFAHMCAVHGKLVQLWTAGEVPRSNLLARYRALANDFGLTPVAQSRISARGGNGPSNSNPFARNGAPRQP
jgi:hypothetical protein